ncbi:MAG: response regulator transcription factor [Verrucomicrobiales bacterium]|nr:response regulator transcription factor [Verrucomicrobiales bacterium]
MRVLLIEDHPTIRESIARALRGSNYAVDLAADGKEGLWKAEDSEYDAIVLDVMLPVMDGWEVLSRLRKRDRTPVLMLTALDAVEDRIRGLDEGADDYLAKPFEMDELEARLRALIRRSAGHAQGEISLGPYLLNLNRKQITRMGEPVPVTALEYALIEFLAINRGKVVSRTELYEHLFDEEDSSFSNTLDVRISKIRAKLGKDFIVTHRGLGYSIAD